MNCCDRDKPGMHWLAMYNDENSYCRLEVFDSFGQSPYLYNLQEKLPRANVLTYNTKQIQSLHSDLCGQYCLYYIYFKARGFAISDIIGIFSNDYYNNDVYV